MAEKRDDIHGFTGSLSAIAERLDINWQVLRNKVLFVCDLYGIEQDVLRQYGTRITKNRSIRYGFYYKENVLLCFYNEYLRLKPFLKGTKGVFKTVNTDFKPIENVKKQLEMQENMADKLMSKEELEGLSLDAFYKLFDNVFALYVAGVMLPECCMTMGMSVNVFYEQIATNDELSSKFKIAQATFLFNKAEELRHDSISQLVNSVQKKKIKTENISYEYVTVPGEDGKLKRVPVEVAKRVIMRDNVITPAQALTALDIARYLTSHLNDTQKPKSDMAELLEKTEQELQYELSLLDSEIKEIKESNNDGTD